ncbi:hypothetical protein MKW94_018548 [Papaver nudicaule]|uniref:Wax synthase domain-containing protein n=1 Tax=Papaver nudicaule TaxID=74823 RepID=A0AA41VY94_PAPNU|nr:hypothetical protein [Papaver nudicaule]
MENEFGHDSSGSGDHDEFGNVCLTILSSLTYCYFISGNIPKGYPRLLSILPIIYIFTLLPLHLSSLCLTFGTGFFISWLGSFKLLLFSFDKGPLSSHPTLLVSSSLPSPMTFIRFLGIACLPIKLTLVFYAALARLLLDIDVDPPFGDYFFLATSFQDFWGKRWNIMVSSILRSIVYEPVRHTFKRSWGVYVAILATFFVSGLMHELLIFYVFRKQPCWDVLLFFILHGICVAVEIKVKRSLNGKCQLNRLFFILLMNVFHPCCCFWLLFPFVERCNFPARAIEEITEITKLLNNVLVNTKVLLHECIPYAHGPYWQST